MLSGVTARGMLWGRVVGSRLLGKGMGLSTDMKDLSVGRKTRSLEEQLRKLKNPGGVGEEDKKLQSGGGPSAQAREGGAARTVSMHETFAGTDPYIHCLNLFLILCQCKICLLTEISLWTFTSLSSSAQAP